MPTGTKRQSQHHDTRTKTDRNVLRDKNTSADCTENEQSVGNVQFSTGFSN